MGYMVQVEIFPSVAFFDVIGPKQWNHMHLRYCPKQWNYLMGYLYTVEVYMMINDISTNRMVPYNNTRYAPNWILIFFFSIIGNWDSPTESICEMYRQRQQDILEE